MPLMNWDNSLDIGVDKMNSEHKELLSIMNKLFDQYQSKASYEMQLQLINDLAKYTVKHFSDEEAYLESINFPDLKMHKNIHKDLLTKFEGHLANFTKTKMLNDDFFSFLRLWLSAHIKGIDIKYGKFAKTLKAA